MSTRTHAKHCLSSDHGSTPPRAAVLIRESRHRAGSDRASTLTAFVERTTTASGVPLLVDDEAVIAQIARVLS